jgi:hypothetical protein
VSANSKRALFHARDDRNPVFKAPAGHPNSFERWPSERALRFDFEIHALNDKCNYGSYLREATPRNLAFSSNDVEQPAISAQTANAVRLPVRFL